MNGKEMKTGCFRIVPVTCAEGTYRDTFPGCRGNRGMAAVTSSGEIVPCMQLSGTMQQRGESLGNVHTDRLKDLLTAGSYLENICTTVGDIRKNNQKCGGCKWVENCTGGCRALAYLYSWLPAASTGDRRPAASVCGNAREKNPLRQENECVMIIKTPFYDIFIFHVHIFFPVRGKDET